MDDLGSRGCSAVLQGLQSNSAMQHLLLAINGAGDEIVDDVIAVLTHPTLLFLDISYNQITEEGAQRLLAAVRARVQGGSMGALRTLLIKQNPASDATLLAVC